MNARLAPWLALLGLLLAPALAIAATPTTDNKAPAPTAAEFKKYDANGDGKLDETETAKMMADRVERYRQALAKYDLNHNGKLDDDELAKMKEDEKSAAKAAKTEASAEAHSDMMLQKAEQRGSKQNKRAPH